MNGQQTNYTFDLNTGLTQVLNDGTNTYLYGLGRIAQVNTTTLVTDYFMTDALGSVRQLTDAQGDITLANAYEPYGRPAQTAGGAQTSYGFTGEYSDLSGMVYLRARYYMPNAGRFLTRDTWGGDYNSPLSLNRWMYVEGNPVNRIDPSGNTSLIPLVNFRTGEISSPNDPNAPQWEYREKTAVYRAVFDVASAYANAYNQEMFRRSRETCGPELYLWVMPKKISPYEAFLRIHGDSFNFWRLARTSEQFLIAQAPMYGDLVLTKMIFTYFRTLLPMI